jgi:hypothetical protein
MRRNAARPGHPDAQRDALAFPLDDGRCTPSRPGVQLDFEQDELAGPEGDGAMGGQDGDFDSILGQTVPWMKHHGSPHGRQVKAGLEDRLVTWVAERSEFPATVNKPGVEPTERKGRHVGVVVS